MPSYILGKEARSGETMSKIPSIRFETFTNYMTTQRMVNRPDIPQEVRYALLNGMIDDILEIEPTLQLLMENDVVYQRLKAYLEELYPGIGQEPWVERLSHDPEIERAIEEAILEQELGALGVSIASLAAHPEFAERLRTYLVQVYPELDLNRDFAQEFLKGAWADEMNAMLEEFDYTSESSV
jgi:hypothetical protein